MVKKPEETDIYYIPSNFIESGTLLGGMLKLRNVIESAVILIMIGIPIIKLPVSIKTKIVIACFTALPGCLLALIGVSGESLSAFIISFIQFMKNRRIVGNQPPKNNPAAKLADIADSIYYDSKKIISKLTKRHPRKRSIYDFRNKDIPDNSEDSEVINNPNDYLPISKIANGVIYTKDKRYVKIIEIEPVNFLLRSAREQKNIIYSFISYLKISPVRLQFKVISKRADINRHLKHIEADIAGETDERCIALQRDYENLIKQIGSREAVTRRFFVIFEYESNIGNKRMINETTAIAELNSAVHTAKTYLQHCGNNIISHENEDEFLTDVLYVLLNRRTSAEKPLPARINEVMVKHKNLPDSNINNIPVTEVISPESIDFSHSKYVIIDGVYHSYMMIPSHGYRSQVMAGWTSLLVNAGEGIDVDIFLHKQPKDKLQQKLGQQLRINRSKIKEASDTNTDFDDLDGAIRSGYFLKEGIANNEDFYYINILLTITGDSADELEWRVGEMKKLMLSQDLDVFSCNFNHEQAFLSALPIIALNKNLYDRSKRNVLTMGAASIYPFTSYEMCDENGILYGVNRHNNSLIIVDIFNSKVYKNANMAILGTSGAGKTFFLQLMALRMRRKNIQVFIIAPLKGHEFYRACQNIGGEFIQISPAAKNCINIMEIRKVDNTVSKLIDGGSIEKSELSAKIQRLHIFFSLLIPDMNHEEKQLMDDALVKTYATKNINHNNDSLINPDNPETYREMPILGDLYGILIKNPETKRLATIINRLVHGSASTFNQQTNVNLNNKYTVLDISELTGDLLPVGMYVALEYVWDKAKEDRTVEKAIFLDELWNLISKDRLAGEFVLEIFKIIRGYGGSAICASQDLTDFFALDDGKYGKGIINNAKTKVILNLEIDEAERVQSILHLSEAEFMAVTHFERGHGLISTNNNNITVEFRASEIEKSLITTEKSELREILTNKKKT